MSKKSLSIKIALTLILLMILSIGFILFSLIFASTDKVAEVIPSAQISMCKVMSRAEFEKALREGFDPNAGCCIERMIGECALLKPNATALLIGSETGSAEFVGLLLEHKADQNKLTQYGFPLASAAVAGHIDIVGMLLNAQPSLDARKSAVRMAVHAGRIQATRLIVDREAENTRQAVFSTLACSISAELQQFDNPYVDAQRELLIYIIEKGLDPNVSCEGEPLVVGVGRNDQNAAIVKAMIEKRVDLNAQYNDRSIKDFLRSFYDYDSRPKIKALIEANH